MPKAGKPRRRVPATFTGRQLNRAVLDRQLLLDRVDLAIPATLQRVGGLQTQYAPSGYIALWDRLRGFKRGALTKALENRSVVQATLMRGTIHMVAAEDFWAICAGIRESRREWWLRIAKSRHLPDVSYEAVADVLREALADGPMPRIDLVAALERAGFPKPMWEGAGFWVEMVRVPPSGTWERRRADRYGLAEQWLPKVDVDEAAGLRLLLTRYLQAFGPARLADAATWAGVARARLEPVAATMRLVEHRDEAGSVLHDLRGMTVPDPAVKAPVRLLPTWDAALLAHCRAAGILAEDLRPKIFHAKNPQSVGTVLVDGTVVATWAWRRNRVDVDELVPLKVKQRREVAAEAERLTAFYNSV